MQFLEHNIVLNFIKLLNEFNSVPNYIFSYISFKHRYLSLNYLDFNFAFELSFTFITLCDLFAFTVWI